MEVGMMVGNKPRFQAGGADATNAIEIKPFTGGAGGFALGPVTGRGRVNGFDDIVIERVA
jgi:hypothetical protein